jgi:predicted nucleic acid-binding protein
VQKSWIIDADVLIEGELNHPAFDAWRRTDLLDGLIAAIALRTGATVATRNEKDFKAMGCPCENPLAGV